MTSQKACGMVSKQCYNNWGSEPIFVTKGMVVGQVEGVEVVGKEDPF